MMTTFVTAFHPVRNIGVDEYVRRFETLARTGVSILVFLDDRCTLPSYPNVRVIPTGLDLSWIPESIQLPAHRNPEKDTREYLGLMLLKLKYMTDASSLCTTPYLAWIDFGIAHVMKQEATFQCLSQLERSVCPLTTILNPGCWTPRPEFAKDQICWRYCGGFLLGPRTLFPAAYRRQMELVTKHFPALSWEVNYWACMDEFFTWYSAEHNDSMIRNIFPMITQNHFSAIREILLRIGERVEGNLVCDIHPDNTKLDGNRVKIRNLQHLATGRRTICEIGVNAGHSLLLMLEVNPTARYVLFDLGVHRYTRPCVEYIQSQFPNTSIEIIYGDSKQTVLSYNGVFDFIHVDGGHEPPEVVSDYTESMKRIAPGCPIVFDDYDYPFIRSFLTEKLQSGEIERYTDVESTNQHLVFTNPLKHS